jgi:hypothetical protein
MGSSARRPTGAPSSPAAVSIAPINATKAMFFYPAFVPFMAKCAVGKFYLQKGRNMRVL